MAKRRDSTYLPGRRSDHWVKVKHLSRQSAVVIGWTRHRPTCEPRGTEPSAGLRSTLRNEREGQDE